MSQRKTKPDPEVEQAIGKRVREFRERLRYTQTKFAMLIKLTRAQLANIESGRTPLRYRQALDIQTIFRSGLEYFAGYTSQVGEQNEYVWPGLELLKSKPNMLFSEAEQWCEQNHEIAPGDDHARDLPLDIWRRAELGQLAVGAVEDALSSVASDCVNDFVEDVISWVPQAVRKYPQLPVEARNQVSSDISAYRLRKATSIAFPAEQNASIGAGQQTTLLTSHSQESKTIGVQPIISELVGRIRKATQARGSKTKLAKWLGTSPQSVTDWLAGRKEPSGETTLRLLAWVTAEEAKQQKSPASVTAQAEQETRQEPHEKSSIKPRPAEA